MPSTTRSAAAAPKASPPAPRPDHRVDQLIDAAILVGLAALILVGFVTSYRTLRDLAAAEGGYPAWLAPAVPLSFDLGIVVLSLKVARAAREGRTAPVMRLLVVLLSAATVAANASAASTATARLLHVVPPAMFVICFESVVITARRRALTERGLMPAPMPRVRAVRWILAFPSTWVLWRQLVLAGSPTTQPTGPIDGGQPREPMLTAAEARFSHGESAAPSSAAVKVRSRGEGGRPTLRVAALPDADATASRDAAAVQILGMYPSITSPELARRLSDAGWPISVRTAQRLRARLAVESPAEPGRAATE